MIEAKIVFRRDDTGEIVPSTLLNSMEPATFYSDWASGKLRRDVDVTVTNKGYSNSARVEIGLNNLQSPEFHLVGGEVYSAWGELHDQLSLASRLLTFQDVSLAGMVYKHPQMFDISRVVSYAEEVDVLKMDGTKELHTPLYWLDAAVVHTPDWYKCKEPIEVLRDMVLELLQKWTIRDNATVLYLLNNAASITNDSYTFTEFTPLLFSTMRDAIWRWQINTPHCLVTARTLASFDPDWERFSSFTNVPKDSFFPENARLMDITVYCLGAPTDAFYCVPEGVDIFLCGAPQDLGLRVVRQEPKVEVIKDTLEGSLRYGWMWNTYIGTAITNSKAVVTGQYIKQVKGESNYE